MKMNTMSRRRRLTLIAGATAMLTIGCARADSGAETTADSASAAAIDAAGEGAPVAGARAGSTRTDHAHADSARADAAPGVGRTGADTARGVVRRVGPQPTDRLALVADESSLLALSAAGAGDSSALARQLTAAEGLEIVVSGVRTTERSYAVAPAGAVVFRVTGFAVRAADGVEARDGILRSVDGHWMLEHADGSRHPVIGLPAALRDQAGARVFLVGPPTSAPQAFGILRTP